MTPSRRRPTPSERQLARRRFVLRWVKRFLPVAALALLSAVALWPEIERAEDRGRVSFRRVVQAGPEQVRVIEPRYQGVDEQDRPFNVTAAVARQAGSADIVDLEAPRADLLMNDGSWVLLEAREGRFDRPRNHLDLSGQVTLWHDNGSMLETEAAAIDINAGHASGDAPVAAQGPFGTLTSQGFRLQDRGQVVLFTGRARLLLEGG
ncbi:MAG TPA: LPS export ABC transporter periplasmic protein LptC [Acetobacteraceae bacterium]|nr:LPS export ABC transporter periplasmic protein LptC [Acetobacteraceae bacterium]